MILCAPLQILHAQLAKKVTVSASNANDAEHTTTTRVPDVHRQPQNWPTADHHVLWPYQCEPSINLLISAEKVNELFHKRLNYSLNMKAYVHNIVIYRLK